MKAKFLSVLAFFLLLQSCGSFKNELIQKGGKEDAIHNAILDFSNTSRLYKKDSVFSVSFQDTLHKMVLDKIDSKNYKWVKGKLYEGIVTVSISKNNTKLLLTDDAKIGSKGKLPSRYIEKEGKLFYWWDDDYPVTKEALAVFDKYGLLQDDEGGWVKFPDFTLDDAQKGADYYFCKDDLSKYKKVITNVGMGYYDPPNLECSPNFQKIEY